MKTDITGYSDNELSLSVYNIEELYVNRHSEILQQMIDDQYIYTQEQHEELMQDLLQETE